MKLINVDQYVGFQPDKKVSLSFFLQQFVELDLCVCLRHVNGAVVHGVRSF